MLNKKTTRAGLTLVELLVSTAILAVIILLANQLMMKSRETVQYAQSAALANCTARAAADRLRSDLMSVCSDGMLIIGERPSVGSTVAPAALGPYYGNNDPEGRDRLGYMAFTSVAPYRSMVDSARTNSARIQYGMTNWRWKVDDKGTTSGTTPKADDIVLGHLFRQAILHCDNLAENLPLNTQFDKQKLYLSLYHQNPEMPLWMWGSWLSPTAGTPPGFALTPYWPVIGTTWRNFPPISDPPKVTVPVTSLADVDTVYPFMGDNYQNLRVQWTNGDRDAATGRLLWFDSQNPNQPDWPTVTPDKAKIDTIECAVNYGGVLHYTAMWGFHRKLDWPRGLRIRLTVGDPPRPYEVIVDLSR